MTTEDIYTINKESDLTLLLKSGKKMVPIDHGVQTAGLWGGLGHVLYLMKSSGQKVLRQEFSRGQTARFTNWR